MSNIKSDKAKEEINAHTMGYDCSTIQRDSVMLHEEYAINAVVFAEQEAEKRAVKALTHALKYMTSLSKEQKIAIAMHFDDALNDGGQDNGNKKEYAIGEDIHITLVCAESTHECNGCLFDSKDGCMAYAIDDDMLCCINRTDGKDVIFKLKE